MVAPSAQVPRSTSSLRAMVPAMAFALISALVLACQVVVLFVNETGVPSVPRGEGARLLGEVAGPAAITQTFRVDVGGLSGITIEARPFGDSASVSGSVVFTLSEASASGSAPRAVAEVRRPASDVITGERYRVAFPPIEESKGKRYELRIAAPESATGHGIGVWGTRDQTYPEGAATLAGKEQWGDLVFRAHATQATFFQRLEHRLRDQPFLVRSRWTLGAVLAVYNWSLAVFAWYMLCAPRPLETVGRVSAE